MAKQGNAITFQAGTLEITTIGGTPTSVKMVVTEGSTAGGATAVEAPGNNVGTMHAPGAKKYSISASCYVSKTDNTNPGDELPFAEGDYVDAELINESLHREGEFLVEKLDVQFGPNRETMVEISLLCNGLLRTNTIGAVTHS